MEKSALSSEVGGARPSLFTIFTITYKVAVNAKVERADTLLLFNLYPICILWVGALSEPDGAAYTGRK